VEQSVVLVETLILAGILIAVVIHSHLGYQQTHTEVLLPVEPVAGVKLIAQAVVQVGRVKESREHMQNRAEPLLFQYQLVVAAIPGVMLVLAKQVRLGF
jgi:hypothetical protein